VNEIKITGRTGAEQAAPVVDLRAARARLCAERRTTARNKKAVYRDARSAADRDAAGYAAAYLRQRGKLSCTEGAHGPEPPPGCAGRIGGLAMPPPPARRRRVEDPNPPPPTTCCECERIVRTTEMREAWLPPCTGGDGTPQFMCRPCRNESFDIWLRHDAQQRAKTIAPARESPDTKGGGAA
jgi:hypothetical protein